MKYFSTGRQNVMMCKSVKGTSVKKLSHAK